LNKKIKTERLVKNLLTDFISHLDSQIRKNHNDVLAMKKSHILHDLAAVSLGILFVFISSLPISSAPQKEQEKKEEKKQKQKIITEEIVVEAKLPKELPISTTSSIKAEKIDSLVPRNLSEVMSYTSGTFVSTGSKNEFRIKIRGFESQRIVLLYDGIPVYEPFFNSFDLKTITAEEVSNIKVVKGASSVLYGPNALGGVVNVITKRPNPPSLALNTLYDSHNSYSVSSSGAVRWKSIFFSGFASFDKSDGFKWNQNGGNSLRENSDYERRNITGKVYFYPGQKSEILLEAAYYWSEYGIPVATEHYRRRYWRFKSWDRFQVNLGGIFSLFKDGSLKLRSYYVRHDNILDSYQDSSMSELQWESTYKNDSYGAFLLGSLPYLSKNELKFSLNLRDDNVRIQDDVGEEWQEYEHRTFSAGLENHFTLSQKWKLVGGVSLDNLKKYPGENKTSVNPIVGIKFNPRDFIDIHATFSQKSRFPSMKSLYSTGVGNPDLKDERGTSYELGFMLERKLLLSGAVFYNRIRDLINPVRLPDGSQTNLNVGRARLFGFELEFQKSLRWMDLSVNYTYLDGWNEEDNRPLDLVPESQLNFVWNLKGRKRLHFTVWGLGVSNSEVRIFDESVRVPSYFVLNAVLSKHFSNFTLFLKGENLFNLSYVTEPGYPMKGRTVAFGVKFSMGRTREKE
jgi:iron complex outermembrane receptor protein